MKLIQSMLTQNFTIENKFRNLFIPEKLCLGSPHGHQHEKSKGVANAIYPPGIWTHLLLPPPPPPPAGGAFLGFLANIFVTG